MALGDDGSGHDETREAIALREMSLLSLKGVPFFLPVLFFYSQLTTSLGEFTVTAMYIETSPRGLRSPRRYSDAKRQGTGPASRSTDQARASLTRSPPAPGLLALVSGGPALSGRCPSLPVAARRCRGRGSAGTRGSSSTRAWCSSTASLYRSTRTRASRRGPCRSCSSPRTTSTTSGASTPWSPPVGCRTTHAQKGEAEQVEEAVDADTGRGRGLRGGPPNFENTLNNRRAWADSFFYSAAPLTRVLAADGRLCCAGRSAVPKCRVFQIRASSGCSGVGSCERSWYSYPYLAEPIPQPRSIFERSLGCFLFRCLSGWGREQRAEPGRVGSADYSVSRLPHVRFRFGRRYRGAPRRRRRRRRGSWT